MVYVKNIVSDMRIYPGMCFLCKRIKVKDLQMEYRKHIFISKISLKHWEYRFPLYPEPWKTARKSAVSSAPRLRNWQKKWITVQSFCHEFTENAPRIIGVIVPDIVTHFFASILNGIENMAIANGYFVIITTSHESYEHEKRNVWETW